MKQKLNYVAVGWIVFGVGLVMALVDALYGFSHGR